jgi:hypothetical protein
MQNQLTTYLQAGYPGLAVISSEEARAEAEIAAACTSLKRRLHAWSSSEGLVDTKEGRVTACPDPLEALQLLDGMFAADSPRHVVLFRDLQLHLDQSDPMLVRRIKDILRVAKGNGHALILLGCRLKLPPELEHEITHVDFSLPGIDLNRDPDVSQLRTELRAHSTILHILADRGHHQRTFIKGQPILRTGNPHDFQHHGSQCFRIVRPESQQVEITGRTVQFAVPDMKQGRSLQNKLVRHLRPAQPVKHTLDPISREHVIERLATLARQVQQPLADRFDVPFVFHAVRDSR